MEEIMCFKRTKMWLCTTKSDKYHISIRNTLHYK